MNYTTIRINNARFFAYHGVHKHEKEFGSQFEVDVEMECDLSKLKDSDDINKTVDYLSVYNLVKEIFDSYNFNLIETLNKKICDEILNRYLMVKKVKVNIRKPGALLGMLDSVEIINTEKKA